MELMFSRKEYKYRVPHHLLNEFLTYFNNKLRPDAFNNNRKPYEVRSLYFDSPTFMYYSEKIDGNPYRKKVRLRCYSDTSENGPLFLEIKNKNIEKIYKERIPIERNRDNFLNKHNFSELMNYNSGVVNRCHVYQKMHSIQPKVLVYYNRVAFVDKKLNFKVNADFDIKSMKTFNIWENKKNLSPVINGEFIMELKYEKIIPNFFIDFVMEHNLQREPFSKYSESIENSYRKYR